MPVRRRRAARKPSLGLALGAGGARGIAHIGVLNALTHAGIAPDAIVGTSVGALVGAIYAVGQLQEFERLLRVFQWPDVLRLFDPVWPRSGLISGARALDRLGGLLGDWRIEDLPIRFAAVSVDLITGEEVVITQGRVIDAIRSSISIPGIFVPHRVGRQLLVDGALRNPVPVSALEMMESDVRVAVNLHSRPVREIVRPASGRRRGPARSVAARLVDSVDRRLARLRGRPSTRRGRDPDADGPNIFEILTASMTVLEHELARHRLARDPVDVILGPDVHDIRSFEFHKARQAILAGLVETRAQLPAIRSALERRPRRRRQWARS